MPKSTALTSIAVVNAMVGSSLIILPLNFLKYGIIVNIFFVVAIILNRFSWLSSWDSLVICSMPTQLPNKSIFHSLLLENQARYTERDSEPYHLQYCFWQPLSISYLQSIFFTTCLSIFSVVFNISRFARFSLKTI